MSEQAARLPGIQIARVAGVPVQVMPSWLLFAAYLVITGEAVLRTRVDMGTAYALAAAFVLLLLVSVVLHELGHCLVARAFDLPVRSITITILAGFTEITEPAATPGSEYAVAVAGPLVSLLLCGLSLAGAGAAPGDSVAGLLLLGLAACNGVIAVLNLLPGLPLDGGRVLRAVLWHLGGDADRATRASAYAGMALAIVVVPVVVVGVLPSFGIGDRSLLTVLVSALVGAFIYTQALGALQRARLVATLPRLSVAALARPAVPVPADTPVSEAVRRAQEAGAGALLIVDGGGQVAALVSESWVRRVPVERRPWVTIGEGARRLVDGLRLDATLTGEALLRAMEATPASEYLVAGSPPRVLVSADVAAAVTGTRAP